MIRIQKNTGCKISDIRKLLTEDQERCGVFDPNGACMFNIFHTGKKCPSGMRRKCGGVLNDLAVEFGYFWHTHTNFDPSFPSVEDLENMFEANRKLSFIITKWGIWSISKTPEQQFKIDDSIKIDGRKNITKYFHENEHFLRSRLPFDLMEAWKDEFENFLNKYISNLGIFLTVKFHKWGKKEENEKFIKKHIIPKDKIFGDFLEKKKDEYTINNHNAEIESENYEKYTTLLQQSIDKTKKDTNFLKFLKTIRENNIKNLKKIEKNIEFFKYHTELVKKMILDLKSQKKEMKRIQEQKEEQKEFASKIEKTKKREREPEEISSIINWRAKKIGKKISDKQGIGKKISDKQGSEYLTKLLNLK
jgi:hypothetical protein